MAYQDGQEDSVHTHILRGVTGSSPGAQGGIEVVMEAAVGNSILKFAPVPSTYSALIKIASGRSTPESVTDQVNTIVGKFRGQLAEVTFREVAILDTKEVNMADNKVVAMNDHLTDQKVVKVKSSSPRFFSF